MEIKNRSIHELLIVMRDNFDKYFETGLCLLNLTLLGIYYSYPEFIRMRDYIDTHRPRRWWINPYSWPVGQSEPRKKWLEKQIKKTE